MNKREWQPIQTAPKDGRILALYGGVVLITHYEGGSWIDDDFNQTVLDKRMLTHWMPLPEPAKEDGE